MVADVPEDHRRFLAGFERGEPGSWPLLEIPEARRLPAVMWKQRNLAKLPGAKRRELVDALERVLFPRSCNAIEGTCPLGADAQFSSNACFPFADHSANAFSRSSLLSLSAIQSSAP
jgi:hypothetical protein